MVLYVETIHSKDAFVLAFVVVHDIVWTDKQEAGCTSQTKQTNVTHDS